MNEQDANRIMSAKLDEAERAITALIRNDSDKEVAFLLGRYSQMAKSRWHGKKLLGLLASYAVMRGMRLAGRM